MPAETHGQRETQEEGDTSTVKTVGEQSITSVSQVEGEREAHTVPLPPTGDDEGKDRVTDTMIEGGSESAEEKERSSELEIEEKIEKETDEEEEEDEEEFPEVVDLHKVEKDILEATAPLPKDKTEEVRVIREMLAVKMTTEQTWYIISKDWLLRWKEYVGWHYSSSIARRPGSIDNMGLVDEATWTLKPRLFAEHDYTQVPDNAWSQLIAWYGGGPAIPRPVIAMGASKSTKMETYPLSIWLVHNGKLGEPVQMTASRSNTVGQLKRHGCKLLGLRAKKIKLFTFHVEIKGAELSHLEETLENARVTDRTKILFEEEGVETPKGISARTNTYSSYSSPYSSSYADYTPTSSRGLASTGTTSTSSLYGRPSSSSTGYNGSSYSSSSYNSGSSGSSSSSRYGGSDYSSIYANSRSSMSPYNYNTSSFSSSYGSSKAVAKGLTGLTNVGNTCFMNSALQCLSNTSVLRRYFLSGDHVSDLNRTNPIGMGGKIAEEYAALIQTLWSGERSSVAPSRFKATIGQFAPQFSGFAQQDSQELLAFLLDGLHEDLNRVLEKPLTSTVESDGRADEVVAQEAWEVYLRRNRSIVVDHFVGQFKSKLVCPSCEKISITFDPFMYLSLPLPEPSTTVVRLTLVRWYSERPVEYALVVPRKSTIAALRKQLGDMAGVDTSRLPIAYVSQHEIQRIFRDSDPVTELRSTYLILALEVPKTEAQTCEEVEEKKAKKEEKQRKKEEKRRKKEEKQRKKSGEKRKSHGKDDEEEPCSPPACGEEPEREAEAVLGKEQLLPVTVKCVLSTGYYRTPRDIGFPFLLPVTSNKTTVRQVLLYAWDRVAPLFPEEDEDEEDEEDEEAIICKAKELLTVRLLSGEGFHAASKTLELLDESIAVPKNARGLSVTLDADKVVKNVAEVAMRTIEDSSVAACGTRQEASKKKVSLSACLEAFVQPEVLSPTDPWFCPSCKQMRQATKTMSLHSLPNVLIIHLKRFKYTRHHRDKLQTLVQFPLEGLDVTSFLPSGQDSVYDLFAVSNHFGALGGGHYTAFAKNDTTGVWYDFDDSRVSKISSEDRIVSESAYLLFYVRRGSAAAAAAAASAASSSPARAEPA